MDLENISLESFAANKAWILELAIKYGLRVVWAFGLLFMGWMFSLWAKRSVQKILGRSAMDITVTKFISSMVRYIVLALVLLSCLNVFGIKTTSIAAMLGAAGLAVGLALQGTLSHLAAGFMLLLFRPFKVGDYIDASGESGTVEEIQIFTTTLKTISNVKVIIPNGNVFGSTIRNYSGFDTRRVDVSVGTDYSADLLQTRKILESVIEKIETRLPDPAPQVFLSGLGDSAINWQIRIWVESKDYWPVYENMVYEIKTALDKAKIGIPFQQMDVHVKKQ